MLLSVRRASLRHRSSQNRYSPMSRLLPAGQSSATLFAQTLVGKNQYIITDAKTAVIRAAETQKSHCLARNHFPPCFILLPVTTSAFAFHIVDVHIVATFYFLSGAANGFAIFITNFAMKKAHRRWRICGQMAHPDVTTLISRPPRTLWRFQPALSAAVIAVATQS